jgi:hypothetical protein
MNVNDNESEENEVVAVRIRSPGSALRQKFLEAEARGDVVTLLSQESTASSPEGAVVVASSVTEVSSVSVPGQSQSTLASDPATPQSSCQDCGAAVAESWMTHCRACYDKLKETATPSDHTKCCQDCHERFRNDYEPWKTRCTPCQVRHREKQQRETPTKRQLNFENNRKEKRGACYKCGGWTTKSWMTLCRACYSEPR